MEFRGSVSHKCEIPFKSLSLNSNEELTTRGVTLIDSLLAMMPILISIVFMYY